MDCGDSQLSKLSDNRNRKGKEGGRGREDNVQYERVCEAPKGSPLESVPSNSLDTLLCTGHGATAEQLQHTATAHSNSTQCTAQSTAQG